MRIPITLFLFSLLSFPCFSQKAFSPDIINQPQKHAKEFEGKFVYREVPVFIKNRKEKSVILKNDYASSVLQMPIVWPLKLKQYYIKEVKVIFTKYPADKNFWNTNYYDLLAARLKAAFQIDSALNDSRINYSLVLQTSCKTEEEAKLMLHGIEIVYETGVREKENEEEEIVPGDSVFVNSDSLMRIRDQEKAYKYFKKNRSKDTVVLKGLDGYKLSDSLLIVVDCTGSMAPYYSQVSLWISRNFKPGHYYVMFNDAGSRFLPLGKTGGYEEGRVHSVTELIKLFKFASGPKGANKEVAENDIEGLLVGILAFPDNKGIVLVADNANCVRDYKLLADVDQPVNVIPCGAGILNPQFLNIAWYSGGTVYWKDIIYSNWTELCNGNIFQIDGTDYRFLKAKQRFEALDYNGDHISFCDMLTTKLRKKVHK
jgi:hypothetical protein